MKFLSTVRFDLSDDNVYAKAAGEGEWALSGAFLFAGYDEAQLTGKHKQAFANGFLGLTTLGHSTFVCVAEMTASEYDEVHTSLCQTLIDQFGAPDPSSAQKAATEEMDFVKELCTDVPINTVFTVRRKFNDKSEVVEEFRTIRAPDQTLSHAKIWSVDETDG